jgi:hypothetical protein
MTPEQIAAKFEALDVHDDTAESIVLRPATSRATRAKVEIVLFRHWENKRRLLVLNKCANLELMIDTDVLRDNSPNNTCGLEATADVQQIEALIRQHKLQWNVDYEAAIDPLTPKLAGAAGHVLFRVRLFGGTLLVLARTFSIKRLKFP